MRSTAIIALFAVSLLPAAAFAQSAPQTAAAESAPATSPARASAGSISRDEYIHRAEERARQRAAAQFDRMDTDHDGFLEPAERRAWRSQHPRGTRAPSNSPVSQ